MSCGQLSAPPKPAQASQVSFETLVPVHDSVSPSAGSLPRIERGFPCACLARIIPFTAHVSQPDLLKQKKERNLWDLIARPDLFFGVCGAEVESLAFLS